MNPEAWLQPEDLFAKCQVWLHQHGAGATEETLGLRVHLEFRASPWCGPRCTISSPMFSSLQQALQLNARLLKSRSTSWEAMRAEWVQLLMVSRRCQLKLTSTEAEAIA